MIDLTDLFRTTVSSGSLVALPLAFAGGVIASLNPCCIPLYPAVGAVCCAAAGERVKFAFWNAIAFVIGVALATAVLGVAASIAGKVMVSLGGWISYLIALIPILVGMQMLSLIRLPVPRGMTTSRKGGVLGAFAFGLILSLVVSPCGTPLLASVLSYAAYRGNAGYGGLLLFSYGLGNGLPIVLIGTVAGGVAARLNSSSWQRVVNKVAGVVLVLLGLYLMWIV